jgi:hypothetical protein
MLTAAWLRMSADRLVITGFHSIDHASVARDQRQSCEEQEKRRLHVPLAGLPPAFFYELRRRQDRQRSIN